MKKILAISTACLLIAISCGRGVTTPGNDIRSALPEKSNTLADAWPEAEQLLFAAGRPVQYDTYTAIHRVSGSGIITIDVRSHDFDPIAALIDSEGTLLAFCDNWKQTTGARLVVENLPSEARLLVFSPDDSRGLYDVLVREGTSRDLDTFQETMDLSSGRVTGWIEDDMYDSYLDRILREALQDDVYNTNYPQAKLYPFSLESQEFISLLLESDDFDPYLVLLEVNENTYGFIEYSDDYSGSNSRITRDLEAGDYIALVMPYSTGSDGRFALELDILDETALEVIEIEAPEPGITYTGEIITDRNFAIGWWPMMGDDWEAPGFITPFTPVAGFVFNVERTSVFEVNASSDIDVCLTLLQRDDGNIELVSSNDDYPDLGSDSRLIEPLFPGEYIGLVSPYGGSGQGEVSFSWGETESDIGTLREGRSVSEYASYETESLLYSFSLQEGRSYSISVESVEMDPIITLILADGQRRTDDDGGEGTSSLLNFTVGSGQEGDCFLLVEKYSGGEGTFTIMLERTD